MLTWEKKLNFVKSKHYPEDWHIKNFVTMANVTMVIIGHRPNNYCTKF